MDGAAKIKSRKFSLRAINLYKYLTKEKREFVLSKQFLRSATSIGANLAEAECAISERDFLSKIYVALKESNETIYWLDILLDGEYINEKQHQSMVKDCEELKRIFMATTRTLSSKINVKIYKK